MVWSPEKRNNANKKSFVLVNIFNSNKVNQLFSTNQICSILWTHIVNLIWYHIASLFTYIPFNKFWWLFILQYFKIIIFEEYIICISVGSILVFKMIIVLNNLIGVNACHSGASLLTDNL